jgi:hypothetical protein
MGKERQSCQMNTGRQRTRALLRAARGRVMQKPDRPTLHDRAADSPGPSRHPSTMGRPGPLGLTSRKRPYRPPVIAPMRRAGPWREIAREPTVRQSRCVTGPGTDRPVPRLHVLKHCSQVGAVRVGRQGLDLWTHGLKDCEGRIRLGSYQFAVPVTLGDGRLRMSAAEDELQPKLQPCVAVDHLA